ncbi:PREDICTED: LOB domain-containing protein 29 [Nelumbo nucifera]|uniref:LOB domain-containing protein 29 n=1 Tax=Nelumbo nucifera TaxID=4432 RepID=A0A1U8B251_NELNU|nr:PREDICTED: LOB domain-containing protein 29 [Nelumbo nucifera]
MTGFGSPCGACKFLRRKCVKGCVFAPYFCHEQGATHFAAIHKVFGASNVSKLLAHLPVTDRCEAAVTISYEAQARLQDPIYGCVSHIFALQQQVVNLQAQLASLKAQAAQNLVNGSTTATPQEDTKFYGKFPSYPQDVQAAGAGLFNLEDSSRVVQQFHPNPANNNADSTMYYNNGLMDMNPNPMDYQNSVIPEETISYNSFEDPTQAMASLDMQTNSRKWAFQDMEDLQSVAFSYLQRT